MTEKKKGWWSRVSEAASALIGKPKEGDNIEAKMSTLGITIERQKTLQARLSFQSYLYKYLSTPITETDSALILRICQRRIDVLDAAICLTGTDFVAPGENNAKAIWVESWQGHRADATLMINAIQKYYLDAEENENTTPVQYENINAKEIVSYVKDNIENHYIAVGKSVLNKCFMHEHTTPDQIVMVQSAVMPMMGGMGGGETLTSSGGRTSEDGQMQRPDYRPVSRRIPNKP